MIKVGVIGCGSIARFRHLPEYENHVMTSIVAVCDTNHQRADEMARLYGAKAYYSYEALLENEQMDAVSVCTPNYLHADMTIAALQKGKHVLCEKPMAVSVEEAERMIQASKEHGKKLMIAHNQRFVPSHEKARELIATGEIGKIYSFRTAFGHPGPESWSVDGENSWFFQKEKAQIGAMGDLGVHKTDLLRFLLNEEIEEVAAFVETSAKKQATVDDTAVCILKTESGVIGTLAASWSYVGKEDNSTIIYGEKGIVRLEEHPEYALIVQYGDGTVVNYALGHIQSNDSGGQNDTGVIDRFVTCIKEDREPAVSGEEGKRSLAVIMAALKAHQEKRTISIRTEVLS
ncbi:NADH-dependent dehydrogenase [Fictibacillus macauensis ZFHKF-1]|uniref:NADH-dependent dehydrogenase n=1 Tax=Fictibacillus macauensis ZFHKF-1 TaxID=1196324 RepID=I8AKE5_9BACL|nr:Gfo/Idh/MocA family oxidoreductase [Fictibacillus macauensis]EIT86322.1 NADH-dependent dehydrogenase [Fictibacillus macauensis ZFHKF-1]